MIDSLLGLVMLMLLTGWMAGVVSIQAMLSSPARSLTPREQVDLLAAVRGESRSEDCDELVDTVKSKEVVPGLRKLLLAPSLMVREDRESVAQFIRDQSSAGELPYRREDDLDKLLRESSDEEANTFYFDRNRGDWFVRLSRGRSERLYLCD